jgi:hypothetical protein
MKRLALSTRSVCAQQGIFCAMQGQPGMLATFVGPQWFMKRLRGPSLPVATAALHMGTRLCLLCPRAVCAAAAAQLLLHPTADTFGRALFTAAAHCAHMPTPRPRNALPPTHTHTHTPLGRAASR